MRVFKNRAEAEAAGYAVPEMMETWARRGEEKAIVRTDLEAQLVEALEAVEWTGRRVLKVGELSVRSCPICGEVERDREHHPDCKLALALKSARGECP